MIVYLVQIRCNGCDVLCGPGMRIEDQDHIHEAAESLHGSARWRGWTVQGSAHWCPECTRQRRPAEGAPVSQKTSGEDQS